MSFHLTELDTTSSIKTSIEIVHKIYPLVNKIIESIKNNDTQEEQTLLEKIQQEFHILIKLMPHLNKYYEVNIYHIYNIISILIYLNPEKIYDKLTIYKKLKKYLSLAIEANVQWCNLTNNIQSLEQQKK